jgi:hypothetical protein
MFGQMVMDALEAESKNFVPRRRQQRMRELFKKIPQKFKLQDLISLGYFEKVSSASCAIGRWVQEDYVKKTGRASYEKLIKELP